MNLGMLFFGDVVFRTCVAPLFPEELWTAPGSGCRLSVFLHAGSQQLGRCLERASGAMLGFLTVFQLGAKARRCGGGI